MQPTLTPLTPSGSPAKYHADFSMNMSTARAAGIDPTALGNALASALRGLGAELVPPPAGHMNPEVTRQPVGLGSDRVVFNAETWITVSRQVLGANLNTQAATAYMNAGGGRDFPVTTAALAMGTCITQREAERATMSVAARAAEAIVPGLLAYRDLTADVGTCCTTVESFNGDPQSNAGVSGVAARIVAGPIDGSNNPTRIGEEPVVFNLGSLGVNGTEIKVFLVVAGVVLVLGVTAYFVRSFRAYAP